MAIGNKIKTLLKRKKMKVATLASLTNIPEQTLYAIIRRDSANVDLSTLRKICAATEVNISYFYGGQINVQSISSSVDAADHISFSAIDLPTNEPNEKHFDIAINYIVLSILENMAEEQGCAPSDVIEKILTENLKNYATVNEMTIISEDNIDENSIEEVINFNDANDNAEKSIAPSSEDAVEETSTRSADLPYWMF